MRSRRPRPLPSALGALALLAAAGLAAAAPDADPKAPLPDAFGESIDVRVVNVEVVVTDRAGRRVRGLAREEFELLVDGEPVPIDYFSEVVGGAAVAPPAAEAGAADPSAPAAAPPPAQAAAPVGRSYLLFIDDSFALATRRDQVLARLERDLAGFGPGDQMAIVAYDGRGLELLAPWSADRGALTAALERARRRPAAGITMLAARRAIRREEVLLAAARDDTLTGGGDLPEAPGRRGERPVQLAARLNGAVGGAAAALRGVPLPEGRKVLLLLSGGWPFAPNDELLERDPTASDGHNVHLPRGEAAFRPLTDAANLLGYTVYPIDVTGIDPLSNNADVEQVAPAPPEITSTWERESHDGLHYLAEETGGRALLNSARLEALRRVAEDTDAYYWLGFTPEWQADDRRHRLEVRLLRPGLAVRARSGFTDLSAATAAALETESVLLFGAAALPVAPGRRLEIEAGKPARAGLQRMSLPLTVSVPVEALVVVPTADGYRAEATLTLAALDRWGGQSTLPKVRLSLLLPEPPQPGSFARHQMMVKLRRIEQRLVVAVHDSLTGAMLWADLDVAP